MTQGLSGCSSLCSPSSAMAKRYPSRGRGYAGRFPYRNRSDAPSGPGLCLGSCMSSSRPTRLPAPVAGHRRSRTVNAALLAALLAAAGALLGLNPPEAGAIPTLSIYNNALDTPAKREKVLRSGRDGQCQKNKSKLAFKFTLGKRTRECAYRLPVAGRSIEVSAVGTLFESTPAKVVGRSFLSLSTRQDSDGSRYQLVVFPKQKKFQLRKIVSNGSVRYLAIRKNVKRIGDPGSPIRMMLRSFNRVPKLPSTTARLVVRIEGKRLAVVDDPRGLRLKGRAATFSIGSSRFAQGANGSFRDVDVRIPDPFD